MHCAWDKEIGRAIGDTEGQSDKKERWKRCESIYRVKLMLNFIYISMKAYMSGSR